MGDFINLGQFVRSLVDAPRRQLSIGLNGLSSASNALLGFKVVVAVVVLVLVAYTKVQDLSKFVRSSFVIA